MIRLTCTHCKATLEMDDAFAGGVCRCQHCGTIQTVPSHAKSTAYPQPATKSSSKSLYKGRTTTNLDSATSSSSGLDELASAVASSGSGGSVPSVSGAGGESGAVSGPRFCDLPLTGQRVVYVLDRGDASKMLFDPLKNAAYKSVETLGDDREFAIVFWKRSTDSG